ncbi:MAG: hypothetical protein Q8O33_17360 [Pseudomonadota bacterium]|nr:hypothetical protein [Pseudomonadota bacterium]
MRTSRLRAALTRLNPALPPDAIAAAVDELTQDHPVFSPLRVLYQTRPFRARDLLAHRP